MLRSIKVWLRRLWQGVWYYWKSGKSECLPDTDNHLTPEVREGSEITRTQRYLRLMGFPIGNVGPNRDGVDGLTGIATEAALILFKQMVNLEQNGTVDSKTLAEVEKTYRNGLKFRELTNRAFREGIRPDLNIRKNNAAFVNTIYFYAVVDEEKTKIPAAATTAQAVLETGYGRFIPVDKSNGQFSYNLFGIKGAGPAGSVASATYEEDPDTGQWKPATQFFRAYHSFAESIQDHNRFFYENKRYQEALTAKAPEEFIRKIAEVGYATDSNYAVKLIAIIKYWGLI